MNRVPVRPLLLAAAAAGLLPAGCRTLQQLGAGAADIAAATGAITSDQAASIKRGSEAVIKTFEDLTPEQEYYIGRAVAATVISRYRPLDDAELNRYVNLVGQSLAQASDRPFTFGGYHFLVLDSDEINAFAAPGGLVAVTRGMLRCCGSEAAVAAVLAHEIGHVELRHGLRAIRQGRLSSALTTIALEAGKHLAGEDLAQVTRAFEGSIGDITQTLMTSGYSRAAERQADAAAVRILQRVGYDPRALTEMLEAMQGRLKPGGPDFAKTHPDPADRIRDVNRAILTGPAAPEPPARRARFARATRGI